MRELRPPGGRGGEGQVAWQKPTATDRRNRDGNVGLSATKKRALQKGLSTAPSGPPRSLRSLLSAFEVSPKFKRSFVA